jgi:hypothetical protein
VGFAEGYVTSISRPLSNSEHWQLYYFETHADGCDQCFEPLAVARSGGQLCDKGKELAVEVARLVFCRQNGAVYSREKEGAKEVRVELPHNYVQTLGLLQAIQRGLRKGQTFLKPKSQDRSYYVFQRPRTPERMSRTPEPMPRYEVRLATPSLDRAQYSSYRDPADDFAKSRRGSLYGSDMLEMEHAKREARAKVRYNVELREPSSRSYRRVSTYG